MALGARRSTILNLFLSEAVILATSGGVLGLLSGGGIAQVIHLAAPNFPVHTSWAVAMGGLLLSALIGLLAGVLPARNAARLDPIDALRAE